MRKIFVDADALVALLRLRDKNHQKARQIYGMLKKQAFSFLISNTSLYEAITVISQRVSHQKAREFLSKAYQGLSVIFVDREREKRGMMIFAKQTSKNVSLFDCLNMAIMREFGLKEIFSFDRHYKKSGFLRLGIDRSL